MSVWLDENGLYLYAFFLGPDIFAGEFTIENFTHNANLQDLLNMYVYYLMEPMGKITDALLVASEYK